MKVLFTSASVHLHLPVSPTSYSPPIVQRGDRIDVTFQGYASNQTVDFIPERKQGPGQVASILTGP